MGLIQIKDVKAWKYVVWRGQVQPTLSAKASLDPLGFSKNLNGRSLVPINDLGQGHFRIVECNRRRTFHIAGFNLFDPLDMLAGKPYLRFRVRSPASRDLQ